MNYPESGIFQGGCDGEEVHTKSSHLATIKWM